HVGRLDEVVVDGDDGVAHLSGLGLREEQVVADGRRHGSILASRRRHPPAAQLPPSTWMVVPVTNRDRSLARNTATAAASSGSARKPRGGTTAGSYSAATMPAWMSRSPAVGMASGA